MIKKIEIIKFRGFENKEINFNSCITIIAGKNGTSKSTLLGLLRQPFCFYNSKHFKGMSDKEKEMERSGIESDYLLDVFNTPFETRFSNIFKFSPEFDREKEHSYILHLEGNKCAFMNTKCRRKGEIRFNHFKDRKFGSYGVYRDFIKPVIYLGLSRVYPIGESRTLKISSVNMTDEEKAWFEASYNKILLQVHKNEFLGFEKEKSKSMGIRTDYYDVFSNSSGQDNVGKILSTILSFKRLNLSVSQNLKGLLLIDELETTLFAASQIRLFDFILSEAKRLNFQAVFTTHSLELIKYVLNKNSKDVNFIYLNDIGNGKININENLDYKAIENDMHFWLNDTEKRTKKSKMKIFFEDEFALKFFKDITRNFLKNSLLSLETYEMSWKQLRDLNEKLDDFKNSLIIYDGDVLDRRALGKKNALTLPINGRSLECEILNFLNEKEAEHEIWDSTIGGFNKAFFNNAIFNELKVDLRDSDSCKKIFKHDVGEIVYKKFINYWPKEKKSDIINFIKKLKEKYARIYREELYKLAEISKKEV